MCISLCFSILVNFGTVFFFQVLELEKYRLSDSFDALILSTTQYNTPVFCYVFQLSTGTIQYSVQSVNNPKMSEARKLEYVWRLSNHLCTLLLGTCTVLQWYVNVLVCSRVCESVRYSYMLVWTV